MFQMHFIFFHINRNIHDYDTRNADEIQVPYGRLDIMRFSISIAGAKKRLYYPPVTLLIALVMIMICELCSSSVLCML